MKAIRRLFALAPCVLAMAAHGANTLPVTTHGPVPAVLPGLNTGVGQSNEVIACTPLRLTPANATQGHFTNTQISVTYEATQAKRCSDVTLTDDAGNSVATVVRYQNEWPHPLTGLVGAVTVAPVSELATGKVYQIHQAGRLVGSFSTATTIVQRGRPLVVTDQPVNFSDLPKASQLDARTINGMLGTLLKDSLHNKLGVLAAKAALGKEAPYLAKPHARYSARVKKFTYTSSRADGSPIALSGLLIYPENADGSAFNYNGVATVLGQHGSIRSSKPAPSSAATLEVVVGLLAAGKGHVYFAPDLIGLGDTATQPQAFLLAQDTASASEDMLLAVRRYFAEQFNGAELSRDLRIFGASQGGYSAMAVLPSLSAVADVQTVYAGEGPYNVLRTLQSPLLALAGSPRDAYARYEDLSFVPGHLRTLMESYRHYGGLAYNTGDVFTPEGHLQPAFLAEFKQAKFPRLLTHMQLNTLIGGDMAYIAPSAKVKLFHYSKDSLVPAQNTADMLGFLQSGIHRLGSVSRGDCFEDSAFVKLFLFFSSSKQKTHTVCTLYTTDRFIKEL